MLKKTKYLEKSMKLTKVYSETYIEKGQTIPWPKEDLPNTTQKPKH
jgi:hypothetical protein